MNVESKESSFEKEIALSDVQQKLREMTDDFYMSPPCVASSDGRRLLDE
jgi:hypothetical protein